jgi:ABC-2 type transport system ATP-binding protein
MRKENERNQDYIIYLKGLTKNFGSLQALKGIDLQVSRGEFFGLVGPDGAGKTTLIKVLAGILSYDNGDARIFGKDLRGDLNEIRLNIGYVSQRFNLYSDLTVGENIDFFSELYGHSKEQDKYKQKMLDFIGLAPYTDRMAGNLSGGMKQKLALLASLIHEPEFLLLDEPTTGVDPVSRRDFWEIIFELQKKNLTVLASTQYMDEAELFDRIALINKGRFIRTGTTDEIKNSIPGEVIEVLCDLPGKARRIIKEFGIAKDVEIFGDKIHIFVKKADEHTQEVIRNTLTDAGIAVIGLTIVPYSLEDVFIKVENLQ